MLLHLFLGALCNFMSLYAKYKMNRNVGDRNVGRTIEFQEFQIINFRCTLKKRKYSFNL